MELTNFDKNMTAVAFAQAGEHDAAKQSVQGDKRGVVTGPAPVKSKPYL